MPGRCLVRGLLLLTQRVDGANSLRQWCVEQICGSEQRGLEGAGQLGQQHLTGLEVGELAYLCGGERVTVEVTALNHQERVCLGKGTQGLRDGDRVTVHE